MIFWVSPNVRRSALKLLYVHPMRQDAIAWSIEAACLRFLSSHGRTQSRQTRQQRRVAYPVQPSHITRVDTNGRWDVFLENRRCRLLSTVILLESFLDYPDYPPAIHLKHERAIRTALWLLNTWGNNNKASIWRNTWIVNISSPLEFQLNTHHQCTRQKCQALHIFFVSHGAKNSRPWQSWHAAVQNCTCPVIFFAA